MTIPFADSFTNNTFARLAIPMLPYLMTGRSASTTDQPDVIFLDYRMEPMDGLDVLRKIKRFNPDIYLVVISGQDDMNVAVNALKYGAFDYIIKDDNDLVKIEAVLKKIQQVITLLKQRPTGKVKKLLNFLGVL